MSVLIVPGYIKTGWDLRCLARLLASVKDQTVPFDHVLVVDDASPLDHVIDHDFVEQIKLPTNGGPARARNAGIERALNLGAKRLLFTDHDCILDVHWNEEMSRFLQRATFGAAGGMTYSWGSTWLDYYHNINGTLSGKWLLPDKKELWYMPSLNFGMRAEVVSS